METLKKIVTNQYFPAGAVLTAVLLFWAVGLLGGLSLLNNNQPPLTTLTWILFVYVAAVLSPLAGVLAAVDLVKRWRRNRAAEAALAELDANSALPELDVDVAPAGWAAQAPPAEPAAEAQTAAGRPAKPSDQQTAAAPEPAAPADAAPKPATPKPAMPQAAVKKPAPKNPAVKKPGSKKAA
jgi:hypothetical protein